MGIDKYNFLRGQMKTLVTMEKLPEEVKMMVERKQEALERVKEAMQDGSTE